jgi:hypothetical protein
VVVILRLLYRPHCGIRVEEIRDAAD